jgi:hypothetical protein
MMDLGLHDDDDEYEMKKQKAHASERNMYNVNFRKCRILKESERDEVKRIHFFSVSMNVPRKKKHTAE